MMELKEKRSIINWYDDDDANSLLLQEFRDHSESIGGLVLRRAAPDGRQYVEMGSMTLIPSKMSATVYNQALHCQKLYNMLYHRVAYDFKFMQETLKGTIESDEFIQRLWSIHELVSRDENAQKWSLGLFRSDYMTHQCGETLTAKQIELNTIASSMAGLSLSALKTHTYIASSIVPDLARIETFPDNNALDVLAAGLNRAYLEYTNPKAVVLFVVGSNENNFSDIRQLQYGLSRIDRRIKIKYADFKVLEKCAKMSASNKLYIGEDEVAVVYYRYGYSPDQYTNEQDWQVRLMLERSKAIKCPSIRYHLAGSKIIQQKLTDPGVLEKFMKPQECEVLRQSFVGIHSLAKEVGGDEIMDEAMKRLDDYVLKPQREGGGNNFFGDEILQKWDAIKDTGERDAYILMEKIKPPIQMNSFVPPRDKTGPLMEVISELGIYGAVLGCDCCITYNKYGGYLLRTKPTHENEGGFYSGASAIDTPQLVSDAEILSNIPHS